VSQDGSRGLRIRAKFAWWYRRRRGCAVELVLIWLGLAVIVGVAANTRGRNGFGWFLLAVLISPLLAGLLVLALSRPAAGAADHQGSRQPSGEVVTGAAFEPDGLYGGIPYRRRQDGTVIAVIHGARCRFNTMDAFTRNIAAMVATPALSTPVLEQPATPKPSTADGTGRLPSGRSDRMKLAGREFAVVVSAIVVLGGLAMYFFGATVLGPTKGVDPPAVASRAARDAYIASVRKAFATARPDIAVMVEGSDSTVLVLRADRMTESDAKALAGGIPTEVGGLGFRTIEFRGLDQRWTYDPEQQRFR